VGLLDEAVLSPLQLEHPCILQQLDTWRRIHQPVHTKLLQAMMTTHNRPSSRGRIQVLIRVVLWGNMVALAMPGELTPKK
jgi:hypothetical protein